MAHVMLTARIVSTSVMLSSRYSHLIQLHISPSDLQHLISLFLIILISCCLLFLFILICFKKIDKYCLFFSFCFQTRISASVHSLRRSIRWNPSCRIQKRWCQDPQHGNTPGYFQFLSLVWCRLFLEILSVWIVFGGIWWGEPHTVVQEVRLTLCCIVLNFSYLFFLVLVCCYLFLVALVFFVFLYLFSLHSLTNTIHPIYTHPSPSLSL